MDSKTYRHPLTAKLAAGIATPDDLAAVDQALAKAADRPASATERQGERDRLYREYRDRYLVSIPNISERIRRFQRDLAAYRDGAWQAEKHAGKMVCPESIRGTPRELMWQLLVVWPEAMSDRHLHDKLRDD